MIIETSASWIEALQEKNMLFCLWSVDASTVLKMVEIHFYLRQSVIVIVFWMQLKFNTIHILVLLWEHTHMFAEAFVCMVVCYQWRRIFATCIVSRTSYGIYMEHFTSSLASFSVTTNAWINLVSMLALSIEDYVYPIMLWTEGSNQLKQAA